MKILGNRFNLNLLAIAALMLGGGCRTAESRRDTIVSTIRVHLETNFDRTGRNRQVPVYRENPVLINIDPEPILTEEAVSEARVKEVVGGFAICIVFTQKGAHLLENATATNIGKRYVVFTQFASLQDPSVNQSRWLAAPVIGGRVADGTLLFTPDASRDEAYQIIRGLNNVATKDHHTPADIEADKKFFKY